jgi:hypothetical protein
MKPTLTVFHLFLNSCNSEILRVDVRLKSSWIGDLSQSKRTQVVIKELYMVPLICYE